MEANLLTLVTGIQLVAAGIADTLSEYYVNETTMTWDYASKLCQLAKPNISFNESGEYLNMDTGIITGKTWVGYVARFGNLNYEGCYFKNRSSLEPVHSFTTQHKVSVCFSACDTPYFALGEYNKCLCLKDLNGLFIDHFGTCNKQCSSLACGSKTSLSVYTKNTRDPIPSPESKVSTCMTYNKTMHLSTRKCTDKMDGILCPVHTDNGTKYYVREEKHTTWFESLLLCRQTTRSVNDSMAEALNEVNNDTGFYWTTSISLRHFDQNLDLNDETESLPQMYGYVDKNLKLEFKKGSRSFAALCKVGDHEDISTMSAYEKEIGHEVTTLPTDEKDIGHEVTTLPTDEKDIGKSTNVSLGLTVGVSVGIVVFLVLIVLLVLLCRRMYRKADVTPKTRSTLVEQPNYFVLERDYSARAATDHLNQTSPNATGNKSNYDVCIQDRQEDTTQSTNVYNVADSPSRTVDQHLYDHINVNRDQGALGTGPADGNYQLVSAIGDGNTYDVHGSCQRFQARKGQSDNIYNTTCNRMSDGSTYDHVGDVKVCGIAGDNNYSQVRPDVTDKDSEDTYNHI